MAAVTAVVMVRRRRSMEIGIRLLLVLLLLRRTAVQNMGRWPLVLLLGRGWHQVATPSR